MSSGPMAVRSRLRILPPPTTKRWVIRRKAEVVAAVRGGLLSLEEACARYTLTVEEFLSWQYFDRPARPRRPAHHAHPAIPAIGNRPHGFRNAGPRGRRFRLGPSRHDADEFSRINRDANHKLGNSCRVGAHPRRLRRNAVQAFIAFFKSLGCGADHRDGRGDPRADRLLRLPHHARDRAADDAAVHRPVGRGLLRDHQGPGAAGHPLRNQQRRRHRAGAEGAASPGCA